MVKVSVIVPFYNAETSIGRSIRSVCSQSLNEIEILCVDDGSTDNSYQVVARLLKSDNRIRCIKLSENIGPAAARNIGIKNAKGKYVFFLDSDDHLPNANSLEILYEKSERYKVDIVGGNVCFENAKKLPFNRKNFPLFTDSELISCKNISFFYGFWCFLYSKKFIIENHLFFPNLRRFQDPPFLISALSTAKEIYVCTDIVYSYSISSRQIYSNQKVNDLKKGIKLSLSLANQNNCANLINKLRVLNFKILAFEILLKIGLDELIIRKIVTRFKQSITS